MPVIDAIRDFIEQGGPVLWLIFGACLLLWSLILERLWFVRITWPRRARRLVADWERRADRRSWRAKKIREAIISEGGWIDKYMGDGLLAVFGRESGAEMGCRQALAAARTHAALGRLTEALGIKRSHSPADTRAWRPAADDIDRCPAVVLTAERWMRVAASGTWKRMFRSAPWVPAPSASPP